MKKFGIYILGIITGLILIPFVGGIISGYNGAIEQYDNPYHIRDLSMLPEKGSYITSSNLEIFQTLGKGVALAHPQGNFDRLVLLLDNNDTLYYDGEKIKMPSKKCAKQIGVYSYQTKAEVQKTVPAVIIE